ncbi:SigE family RNA polymerase sigma factor [Jiangella asiatica]|uniref:SigE family RNA polymerase sigma factor n=1 Tax=Jiangella asiatica TaxID=2530372 RepID=A0A4R5CGQ4_9ACTN|nr:SigE family RNA polymerase sigma factor [Jiangella asiatica]TDD98216.1 SigE family RNA polymerase sigma factor [Jiangella asiatica]
MDVEAEEQFRRFVEGRSLALLRTAYALTGDRHTAEDLVQGALAKLFRHWRTVDDPEGYVRRIIYNDQVSSWRRRRTVREEPVEDVPERAVSDGSAEVDGRLDMTRLLSMLAPRQRAVLVLRYYDGLTEREIATALGCSIGNVRSQTFRALARLRTLAPELTTAVPAAPTIEGA